MKNPLHKIFPLSERLNMFVSFLAGTSLALAIYYHNVLSFVALLISGMIIVYDLLRYWQVLKIEGQEDLDEPSDPIA